MSLYFFSLFKMCSDIELALVWTGFGFKNYLAFKIFFLAWTFIKSGSFVFCTSEMCVKALCKRRLMKKSLLRMHLDLLVLWHKRKTSWSARLTAIQTYRIGVFLREKLLFSLGDGMSNRNWPLFSLHVSTSCRWQLRNGRHRAETSIIPIKFQLSFPRPIFRTYPHLLWLSKCKTCL